MSLLLTAVGLQLADLASFAIATPYIMHGTLVERNPIMAAAFTAAGLAGVALVKIVFVGIQLALASRLSANYWRAGLSIVALGGLIGATANLLALGVILG